MKKKTAAYFESLGKHFRLKGEVTSFERLSETSWKVTYSKKNSYIFDQQLPSDIVDDRKVFKNIDLLSDWLSKHNVYSLHYHHTYDNKNYYYQGGVFWSVRKETIASEENESVEALTLVKENASALARFQLALSDFDAEQLEPTFVDYHNTKKIFDSLKDDSSEECSYLKGVEKESCKLFHQYNAKKIPTHITLNRKRGLKLCFDKNERPIAIVDLAYAQPGMAIYDFASNVLSTCLDEKEENLDTEKLEAYLEAYLPIAENYLSDIERESIYLSIFSVCNELAAYRYSSYQSSQDASDKEKADHYIRLSKNLAKQKEEIQKIANADSSKGAAPNALIDSFDREGVKISSQDDYEVGDYMKINPPHKIKVKGGKAYSFFKRLFDIIFSFFGLVILSPLMILTAILVKLTSKGPAIYVSKRVGQNGRIFRFYKFRSMYQDADKRLEDLLSQNEVEGGVTFKIKNDPRITPFGRFIRMASIDELPQLWNILKGDMSLIGPRVGLPREVKLYSEEALDRLLVPQGLSGEWQARGRSDTSFATMIKMDLDYIENKRSLLYDLKLIFKTIHVVLLHRGAE